MAGIIDNLSLNPPPLGQFLDFVSRETPNHLHAQPSFDLFASQGAGKFPQRRVQGIETFSTGALATVAACGLLVDIFVGGYVYSHKSCFVPIGYHVAGLVGLAMLISASLALVVKTVSRETEYAATEKPIPGWAGIVLDMWRNSE